MEGRMERRQAEKKKKSSSWRAQKTGLVKGGETQGQLSPQLGKPENPELPSSHRSASRASPEKKLLSPLGALTFSASERGHSGQDLSDADAE